MTEKVILTCLFSRNRMSFVVFVVSGHSRVDKVRVFNSDVGFLRAGKSILGVDLGLVACWLGLKS